MHHPHPGFQAAKPLIPVNCRHLKEFAAELPLSMGRRAVKGPGLRNDLEIRRTFRCPQCGRTVLKLGDVVSQTCPCTEPPVWMQIQPEVKKAPFKFAKIEIPLTDEDLVIRERPRRMPPPPPEGAPEVANDRRNARPKRPKPERRSFESFQEELAAKTGQSTAPSAATDVDSEVVEVTEIVHVEVVTNTPEATASTVDQSAPPPPTPPAPADDEFGEGL